MPTNAFVLSSTWDDPTIRSLDSRQKVAWFWLLTNSRRDGIGHTSILREKFSFESGEPWSAMVDMLVAMQHSVLVLGDKLPTRIPPDTIPTLLPPPGDPCIENSVMLEVVLVNFMRRQFGVGNWTKVTPRLISCSKEIAALKKPLREAFLERYSDFPLIGQKVAELVAPMPTPPPYHTDTMRGVQERKGQDRIGTSSFYSVPTDQQVLEHAAGLGQDMATGAPVPDPRWVQGWLARMRLRDEFPLSWREALQSCWRADWRTWKPPGLNGNGKNGVKPLSVWELQQKLAALKRDIDNHTANESAPGFMPDMVTDAEREELDRKQREYNELNAAVARVSSAEKEAAHG